MWGTVDSTNTSNIKVYPRLTWNGNLEPDVTAGGGYEIWRTTDEALVPGTWTLIDSVSGTTTMYIDSTIDNADTVHGIHFAGYRIRAFDSTNKLSTNSEDRGIYYGEDFGGKMIAHRQGEEMGSAVVMWPNRPNPFSETTEIGYSLTRAGRVTVDVFDARGKRVAVLVDDVEQGVGSYRVEFDGRTLPAGVYLCRVLAHGVAVAEPLTLNR